MMSPVEQIEGMYARHLPEENFWADVMAYLEIGALVVSTPTHFMMARAIERADPQAWTTTPPMTNPTRGWSGRRPDPGRCQSRHFACTTCRIH